MKDDSARKKNVPYLADAMIENDASALLAEYAQARRSISKPPIPIEDIVEKYLKLSLEFDDTHRLFDVPRPIDGPDIIGAIFLEEARIVIDESLDPEDHPEKEGRYRFTLAHEGGGHWRLHRHLFAKNPAQGALFDEPTVASVICRSSEAKKRMEWQADFYASCLLMPRGLVFAAWDEKFPGRRCHVMDRSRRDAIGLIADAEERQDQLNIEEWETDLAMEAIARPFAEMFLVSPHAMRIRLETLNLLRREAPKQQVLAGGE